MAIRLQVGSFDFCNSQLRQQSHSLLMSHESKVFSLNSGKTKKHYQDSEFQNFHLACGVGSSGYGIMGTFQGYSLQLLTAEMI